jgi:hypothetical protein
MALILSKTGITTGESVEPGHVTQSIDAFSGLKAYDITISGSLTLNTGNEGNNKIAISDASGLVIFTGSYTNIMNALTSLNSFTSSYNTGSYTGSFNGNFTGTGSNAVSSSYSSTSSYSPNFSNTDLTFTSSRTHNTSGSGLTITTDGGSSQSWLFLSNINSKYAFNDSYIALSTGSIEIIKDSQSSLIFKTTESIFNDSGLNIDFRVEGDTNTSLIFADASSDMVGIGKYSPNSMLDINGDTIISGSITTKGSFIHNGITSTTGTQSPIISGKSSWSITTTGTDTSALSNGIIGQRLLVYVIANSGVQMTITPTSALGYTTILLKEIGDSVDLYYTSGGWVIVGGHSYSIT